jgi:ParB-like chromosome segregation protein Spo0J
MERENRARKNLSAWEQGTMYRRALDEGLYPSQRKLAEALGVDISLVSKSLALARLPDAVVRAFRQPAGHPVPLGPAAGRGAAEGSRRRARRAVSLRATGAEEASEHRCWRCSRSREGRGC